MQEWLKRVPWFVWVLVGALWIGLRVADIYRHTHPADRASDGIGVLFGLFVVAWAIGVARPNQARRRESEHDEER
ncbi:hypothetical protein [Nonomuraea soli]|uniref:Uncharacterized protein n=1 Tax=Nonomuraea soli TaxID=1032476 RepID=A0A7W0CQ06_9ACTN|nr:hypothetical protein [Nonomuraea soli]MBA2895098.1 hypothetical protein [Nonomuraea soli]